MDPRTEASSLALSDAMVENERMAMSNSWWSWAQIFKTPHDPARKKGGVKNLRVGQMFAKNGLQDGITDHA